MGKTFRRGEVWLVDLGLAAKTRPAVVLSVPTEDQDRALVTIVPHTTSGRGARFEVAATPRFLKAGVFDGQNIVTFDALDRRPEPERLNFVEHANRDASSSVNISRTIGAQQGTSGRDSELLASMEASPWSSDSTER